MTQSMPQPQHEPGDELPVHTVGIFVTYRRGEPIPSKEWAEKTALAFRHAPFIIEAVTAAGLENVNRGPSNGTSNSSEGIHSGGDSPRDASDGPPSDVAGTT